jgi:glycosyltransferase involved in cell wall biosynthesis
MGMRVPDAIASTGVRVAILTNILQPYRVAVFRELERRCESLQLFVSNPVEEGLSACTGGYGLQVVQQRSLRWRETERHAHGFKQSLDIQFPYDTITQLRRFRPDVIVSGELGLRTLQASVYRKLARASRLVIWATLSEITEQARGMSRTILRPVLLRSADAVLVNGRSGARYVERLGTPKERVFCAPQTTDLGGFLANPRIRSEPNCHRLLYTGRLIELKGLMPFLSHLVNWANLHTDKCVDFSIVGDGPLRAALAAYPVPRNLSVRLLGHVPYHRLPEVYARGGILVFPTLADEWGMVVVEGMASGLPVLASLYSQAVEELVVNGQTGWTFRPDEMDEVRSAIDRALSAPLEELDRMGLAARQRVQSMTPAVMAEHIVAAIEYAVTNRARPIDQHSPCGVLRRRAH